MDDMHVSTLRYGAQVPPAHRDSPRGSERGSAKGGWAPKKLHDLLAEADLFDEVSDAPLTLKERMENWGSD